MTHRLSIKSYAPARCAILALAFVSLASCSIFNSGKRDIGDPLKGERLPVLAFEQGLEIDPSAQSVPVSLPPPFLNTEWTQPGGAPGKSIQHLTLGASVRKVWSRSVGEGDSAGRRLISAPVVMGGAVFAMDAVATVSATSAESGAALWRHSLRTKGDKKSVAFGGGVSGYEGKLYATTGFGTAIAMDAKTGAELWRKELGSPLRGAPAVADGRVYVLTQDNQLFALAAATGEEIWNAPAISENAGILGAAAPAISGDTVVVGFSSGELNALRAENGKVTWQDTLARTGRLTALATLTDIDGSPVIDRGRVFAIGHGGRMVALELASGERVWEKSMSGLSTPWVAGDYIFIVTSDGELVCLMRRDGRVRWLTQLQRYTDPEDKKGLVRWQGPILASDRLILTSSNGYVVSASPYTGQILSTEKMGEGSSLPPIIANNTLYVLTQNADLIAYR
jgi:outer membrane protein assembly factor BamB